MIYLHYFVSRRLFRGKMCVVSAGERWIGGNGLGKKFSGREALILAVIAAIALIFIGGYNAWRSFQKFDESILTEKDSQLYSLVRSDDINIENTISSFVREAETFLSRNSVNAALDKWSKDGKKNDLKKAIEDNSLKANPIYADILVIRNEKVSMSATGNSDYTFLTGRDYTGLRVCKDGDGNYYLAYERDATKNTRFDALIDLATFYGTAISTNPERQVVLLDAGGSVLLTTDGGVTLSMDAGAEAEGDLAETKDFIVQCQSENRSEGRMLELTGRDGSKYVARMVVLPSESTVNGEFAIGMITNYEDAVTPSRFAARQILLYGGLAMLGVLALILMILYMSRANRSSSEELRALRKKNEAMEEINQKMQALTHHQRLETIGTMTASIAHDFNNLLTPIMGYSIMTMEMLPPDATDLQENLMEVYNASVKAKDIVTRLAELTKKGSEASYKDIEIDEVIQSALKVTLPAKPKEVEVKANFGAEGVLVKADRTQISQLVMNIVLNAYDAMRDNGGTLMVSTKQAGDEVIMRFKDSGCGMDAETVSRIFDPFYTTKESGKGTGLGLAIVAQIVETHGGRIYVESHPGEGTEFRIYIPTAGSGMDGLSWGSDPESRYDTKRYTAKVFRQELAKAEAAKRELDAGEISDEE